ncbi:hypothetical protein Tco_1089387, partial [Tanacetum coccineum]
NESDEVDIDSMTIAEYELYVAKKSPNRVNGHTDSFTSNFCDQSPCTPNPQPKDEELSFEELERLLAKDLQSYFMKIQVHSVIVKTNEESEPFIHTRPLSPLYGVFKSFKSSTKPYKVEREMTSPPWYDFDSSFPYPIATAKGKRINELMVKWKFGRHHC